MPEKVQNVLNRITEWFKKFSTKQKMLLISITGVILIALVILGVVVNQPKMVTLITCKSANEASQVKSLLDENTDIKYKISSDGMTFMVDSKSEANASILLGSNDIPTEGYSIDKVFDGSFSTTEADKSKKYQLYLEEKFAQQLAALDNIESASVSLSIPQDDGTIISKDQSTYAGVILQLNGEMDEEQAAGIAKFIATEVGNDTTDNINIIDSDGNPLFSGGDTSTISGTASSQLSVINKAENLVKSKVKDVVLGTNVYDNVEVGLNLNMSFNTEEKTDHRFYTEDGQTQGYLDSESNFESTAEGGSAAVPGTDTNQDTTTYVIPDNQTESSTVTENNKKYLPNEEITKTNDPGGNIDTTTSSITVVATNNVVYDEKLLKADGTLDNMTFDQFIAQNGNRVKQPVDAEFYDMVATATGIPTENITITSYDVPFFKAASSDGRNIADYLQIALAVLIFGLLGFVVFKSTRKQEDAIVEPELSVESLLETTKEAAQDELENIGYSEKSETRVLIERFVEENPEAAASLLRNWLNEEWE